VPLDDANTTCSCRCPRTATTTMTTPTTPAAGAPGRRQHHLQLQVLWGTTTPPLLERGWRASHSPPSATHHRPLPAPTPIRRSKRKRRVVHCHPQPLSACHYPLRRSKHERRGVSCHPPPSADDDVATTTQPLTTTCCCLFYFIYLVVIECMQLI